MEKLLKPLLIMGRVIPIFWLTIDAGYFIIDAENIFPSHMEGFTLKLDEEDFKYPAPPILKWTVEEKVSVPGKLVLG